MGEEADALYGLVEAGIEECENYFRTRRSTPAKPHGKMKHSRKSEASMTKRKLTDAELSSMIAAGLKSADLIEIAKEDIILREHLVRFLTAALSADPHP